MECLLQVKGIERKKKHRETFKRLLSGAMFFIILNKFNVFMSCKNTCQVPIKPFFPQVINNSLGLRYLFYG